MDKKFFTVTELSQITGISKCTIYREIQKKSIPTLTIASSIRIPRWWVDQIGQPEKETEE